MIKKNINHKLMIVEIIIVYGIINYANYLFPVVKYLGSWGIQRLMNHML